MPYGVHPLAAYSIALQDNSVFWVCNDFTVRRRNGQTPVRVSEPGIEAVIRNAQANNELTGAYALTPTWDGHPMYILTIPLAGRTLAYDCVTQQWWELSSVIGGQEVQWRALSWYNGFGQQLIGDSQTGTIGFLDATTFNEFGGPTNICALTFQPIYEQNKRITTRRLEAAVTAGAGLVPGYAPKITLYLSDDWGTTFYLLGSEDQTLGVPGDTSNRSYWLNLGQHRSLVAQLRVTDASPAFFVDVNADLEIDGS
jgi:hypothetical protein